MPGPAARDRAAGRGRTVSAAVLVRGVSPEQPGRRNPGRMGTFPDARGLA